MSAEAWYVDTSALVKLVVKRPESTALGRWLADKDALVACELVRVEAVRAVRASHPAALQQVRQAIAALTLIRLDAELYDLAADLDPPHLRSLDAIHLAAALTLGRGLAGVVTYDLRMAEGARMLGVPVATPGRRRGRRS